MGGELGLGLEPKKSFVFAINLAFIVRNRSNATPEKAQLPRRFIVRNIVHAYLRFFLLLSGVLGFQTLQAFVVVVGGGNIDHNDNVRRALDDLEISYIHDIGIMAPDPFAFDLGPGDLVIISNDGGSQSLFDYRPFLEIGGNVIVMGGSRLTEYESWITLYLNTTGAVGWHTDGDWVTVEPHPVAIGLPTLGYSFENNNATFHMVHFLETPDTVLYGSNTEPNFIAAVRTYDNGGSFNYMALDIGRSDYTTEADYQNFVLPWIENAVAFAAIPEPGTVFLLVLGLGLLVVIRRRAA